MTCYFLSIQQSDLIVYFRLGVKDEADVSEMFGDISDDGLTEQELMALLDTVECKYNNNNNHFHLMYILTLHNVYKYRMIISYYRSQI